MPEKERPLRDGREHGVAVVSIWPGLGKSENRLVNAETLPDGRVMLFGLDLSHAETPHFPGRAVVALAADPGFTDVDGKIPDAQKLHDQLKQSAPAFWRDVLGTG